MKHEFDHRPQAILAHGRTDQPKTKRQEEGGRGQGLTAARQRDKQTVLIRGPRKTVGTLGRACARVEASSQCVNKARNEG